MAHPHTVIRSINRDIGQTTCVDLFRRADGSYGFHEFRRDPEDGRGWYSIGHHGEARFDSETEALAAASTAVSWLKDRLD